MRTPPHLVASLFLLLLLPAGPLAAQVDRIEEASLPPEVAEEIVRFVNDSSTLRLDGGEIPSGRILPGDVAVLGGRLTLAGGIEGRVVLLNADLILLPGASIAGDATVVGGTVRGVEEAGIGGRLTVYSDRLRYVREDGRIEAVRPGQRDAEGLSSSLGFGRSRITVRAGTNYNRVEGLPVMFGPIIQTTSPHPLRLEALAVWRTDNGFTLDTEEMGYRVTLEQHLGSGELFALGAAAHSLVEPIESWTVSDLEGSLSTFLFHKDFRDYFERTGWSAFARIRSPQRPVGVRIEYRDEEHRFAPVGSPWALRANDEPWRPQPLVAEGRVRTLVGTVTLDTRNSREDPTDGWWIRARTHLGVGGAPEVPEHRRLRASPGDGTETETIPARPVETDFATGFVDARTYNRIGPTSSLALRAIVAGSLTGDPVPAQFQHAPGGEGSLPGFSLHSVDCGARNGVARLPTTGERPAREVFATYGCDRIALFQAEVRGGLGWSVSLGGDDDQGWQEQWGWDSGFEFRPRWAAFLNAGRGWALSDPGDRDPIRIDEGTRVDGGVGVLVSDLGFYVAFPLAGADDRVNFFVRLDRRF